MLHLISQSSIDNALLNRIDSGDDVVFLDSAICRIMKNGVLNDELQQMLGNRIYLHVLVVELETRGIEVDEIISGFNVIDYAGLVELTENNKVISTWT